ncbi:hypothetical protein BRO54_2133 [Geobacillus proteiniphilus]|uniref:Uncharacterized protein n=1 Tax=Geobacillus proteiniphilus TaxID=860353 RepID=A0A1Q5SYP4_9BACL|nr:hypothetical protein BRO54_2133 [Geobacillus proteiniphilus]
MTSDLEQHIRREMKGESLMGKEEQRQGLPESRQIEVKYL